MSGISDIGFRSCISFISLLFINRMLCDRKRERKENNGGCTNVLDFQNTRWLDKVFNGERKLLRESGPSKTVKVIFTRFSSLFEMTC